MLYAPNWRHELEVDYIGARVNIGLHGTEPGREDDPLCIIPPSPLDAPTVEGPLAKDRREDLQILAF
jgi:hypothetical protein